MSMLFGPWRGLLAGAGGFVPDDVPQAEANALIRFYYATAGPSWTLNTNWLTDPVVNNWQGVTVAGGNVTQIDLNTNNLVGAAGETLAPLAGSLVYLRCNANAITTLDVRAVANGVTYINATDNGMAQAAVDAILLSIYTRRMAFTDATPELLIGGTNAAPGGVYQYAATPSTGNEYRYALVNDDDGEGFNVWAVTV